MAGEVAMDALLGLVGLGDYRHAPIKQNTLIGKGSINFGGQGPPTVMNNGNGTVIVNHRELAGIVTVGTTGAYHYQKFGLNPANRALFPWLADVASNFQQWRLQGCVVHLKSMASNYAANVTLGTIFAGIQYNYYAPDPANMRALANLDGAATTKSSQDIVMPIECAPNRTTVEDLYIDNPGVLKEGDERFNYLGNIYVGYEGVKQSTAPQPGDDPLVLFQIWISYEVALFKPVLNESVGAFGTLWLSGTLGLEQPRTDTTGPMVADFSAIVAQPGFGNNADVLWGRPAPDDNSALRLTFPSYPAKWLIVMNYFPDAAQPPTGVFWDMGVAATGATVMQSWEMSGEYVSRVIAPAVPIAIGSFDLAPLPNGAPAMMSAMIQVETEIDGGVPYVDIKPNSGEQVANCSGTGPFQLLAVCLQDD